MIIIIIIISFFSQQGTANRYIWDTSRPQWTDRLSEEAMVQMSVEASVRPKVLAGANGGLFFSVRRSIVEK